MSCVAPKGRGSGLTSEQRLMSSWHAGKNIDYTLTRIEHLDNRTDFQKGQIE